MTEPTRGGDAAERWTTVDIADQFQRFVRKPELGADAEWVSARAFDALLARVQELETALAECYRWTGADPDGNTDRALSVYAVVETRRLREESDAAEARVQELEAWKAEALASLAKWHALGDVMLPLIAARLGEDIPTVLAERLPAKVHELQAQIDRDTNTITAQLLENSMLKVALQEAERRLAVLARAMDVGSEE